jgi:serine O-acetyltransferase
MTELDSIVAELVASYGTSPRGQHIGKRFLPSRSSILEIVDLCFQLFYPGYRGRQDLSQDAVRYHVGSLVAALHEKLESQIMACLCFAAEEEGSDVAPCQNKARTLATELVQKLPGIRAILLEDVQAAYDGDPAATSYDEIVLAYPGLFALTVHRVAHELYRMKVPLMPRIMAEHAHAQSGADIHPGASIGRRFFIDHATGVVVGETTVIGDDVKLYQGVTLGALSIQKDAHGRVIRTTKRHPTVENGVTIYANATVLGGQTIIGEESVVGGSVFITKSVPKRSRVGAKTPELRVIDAGSASSDEFPIDFEI